MVNYLSEGYREIVADNPSTHYSVHFWRRTIVLPIFCNSGVKQFTAEQPLSAREFGNDGKTVLLSGIFRIVEQRGSAPQLEDALRLAQKSNPDFFKKYALVHHSNSLHESSFTYPRALVFGDDAKMILTFNGSPDQAGYERLEISCFNDGDKVFEYYELHFRKIRKHRWTI